MKSELLDLLEDSIKSWEEFLDTQGYDNLHVNHYSELKVIKELYEQEIQEKDKEIEMLQNDLINYETCCPECGTILKVPKPKLQLKKSDFEWQHECDVDSYQDCADKKIGNKLILKDKLNYENLEE